jgi:hypothetical protein
MADNVVDGGVACMLPRTGRRRLVSQKVSTSRRKAKVILLVDARIQQI